MSFFIVIQMTNAKVQVDKNTNRKFLSTTSRTILTIDPNTEEGNQLTSYANELNPDELMNIFLQQTQPEQFFRKIINFTLLMKYRLIIFDFLNRPFKVTKPSNKQILLLWVILLVELVRVAESKLFFIMP